MLHHQPQILSPLPEMNSQSPTDSSNLRARKMSAGGNRSWSEEEENYLLQTRMQKMPYKHIAAHLKKTELACRLHYHQLSHGSHRRKRNNSVSSTTSCSSAGTSAAYGMVAEQDAYSQSSRHSSPMSYTGSPHVRAGSVSNSPGRSQHKILLPKPRTLTPCGSPEPYNGLRINTEVAHQPKVVDTDRLRSIYESRRQQFWATVAADYGADVSPAQLEEIWRSGSNAVRPPTPDASPDGTIMHNPVFKPAPFQSYASPAQSEPAKHYSPMSQNNASAISVPERMPYVLPMPVPSSGRPRSWSSAPRDNMPIASLLNDDRN
ncbi:hypothetical protein COCC4DRAFT_156026 [Bipolaris maydis ATCC 48331]|uniref:Myb-like domain-containing protein n=2 Tax=Cochliobolus heterostrophus TaxID=5016 RepID=M2UPM2_COCH5|nr:uncharacterized protein COCC4DRAFT_156026 [Bipolaris maydis ATCC 48331]EMD95541.1 hypothetical protein COCHEDRAFT_1126332 [Bipolaris maydis C5]KAH7561495.1 hypothetical protein BM1_02599 [Bipolaris maydis]ENI10405.1 hypothetical protein COCC4DRAFT_156026 [Bipolaris maydis ATCC 48331]KAJ5030298.1 hypothetical protein J3E73DRAFT_404617 [Bipolaris maydis]KAJ5065304.1 hypothetical protein J3E74DRAFT_434997 [Bipolaris maydis]